MARDSKSIMIETTKDLSKFNLKHVPTTFLTEYSNMTLYWFGMDNKELYNKNIAHSEERASCVKQWDGKLTYKLNTHGFRSREIIEDKNCIVALGCSHTFGLGILEEETYISHLAKMLDLNYYNLGVPGAAADTVFRVASYWLPIIKPKFVVMIAPERTRFEIRKSNTDTNVFGPSFPISKSIYGEILKIVVTHEENAKLNRHKNLLAIESITNKNNGKFIWAEDSLISNITPWQNGNGPDKARDYRHPGPGRNLATAQWFYKDIKK